MNEIIKRHTLHYQGEGSSDRHKAFIVYALAFVSTFIFILKIGKH